MKLPRNSAEVDPAQDALIADLAEQLGSMNKAAAHLSVSRSAVQAACKRHQRRTGDFTGGIPASPERDGGAPYIVKGVSTYFDAQGNQRGQWVKTRLDDEQRAALLRAAAEALAEPLRGMGPVTVAPDATIEALMTIYPMGDPHFGLHTWARETGEDFDLAEAERVTCAAIDRLVMLAPASAEATLLNLGDFFHMDDQRNVTPGSGHQLDADTRFVKVVQVGIKAMRWAVMRLLQKHARVRVRNVPGNHDPHASLALSVALDAYFESDPRVTVDMSPAKFTFQRFGKVLIGECHGDTAKAVDLPGVMMVDAREHISATEYWHWHCGHVHHDSLKEYQGVIVETHRTLAATDAWHRSKGYRSGRSMKAVTYHRDFGEVSRVTCDIAMLRAAA
jgi:hypothetical protein